MNDPIGPKHYNRLNPKPIDVINSWGLNFNLGCVLKYISRHDAKGGIEDLKKAIRYLEFEIERIRKEEIPDEASETIDRSEPCPDARNKAIQIIRNEKIFHFITIRKLSKYDEFDKLDISLWLDKVPEVLRSEVHNLALEVSDLLLEKPATENMLIDYCVELCDRLNKRFLSGE